jgi:hypothetical protein
MSAKLKKTYSKKIISMAGIASMASASIFLCLPAFALANSNVSSLNQGSMSNQLISSSTEVKASPNESYPTDDSRLVKGSWLCLNNPNPKCNS